MRRALLGCVLVTVFTTLPHFTGAFPGAHLPSLASGAADATRKGTLTDLRSIEPLKQTFEHDRGKVRLVALVSPT
jgi:hypothetical protein